MKMPVTKITWSELLRLFLYWWSFLVQYWKWIQNDAVIKEGLSFSFHEHHRLYVHLSQTNSPLLCFLFRIIESLQLEKPIRSSSPHHQSMPVTALDHVTRCDICSFLEHLQGQQLHHLPGQPVPMHYSSFRKEIFPNIQPDPPQAQLKATTSCPADVSFVLFSLSLIVP